MVAANPDNQNVCSLLEAWNWRAKRAAVGHYDTARHLDRRHYFIGLVLVSCSVISTSLAGRTMFGLPNTVLDGFMTLFSALTLTIACIHVFLQDANRADKYRRSGARYAAIKREIEQMLATHELSPIPNASIDAIRAALDDLGAEALPIPSRVWKVTDEKLLLEKKSLRSLPPKAD